ncbi:MAG: phosphotransferase family protein [Ktedonobacteraceae bacterium]
MPELRAVIQPEKVLNLLDQHFDAPIVNLTPVEGGQVARTFAFLVGEQEYIIRFNKDNMLTANLPKEAYLSRKLAATRIPIPPILHVGRLGELHFAISRKVPGQMLETLSAQEVKQLLPQLIEMLDTLHHIDVSDTHGYGVFDYQGQGLASSWYGSLAVIAKEEDERDYFGKWHHLFDDTFLERDFFKSIYRRMRSLLEYCPAERYFVHGNYSLRNILVQNGQITAVLDWVDARYGDFVYDIAGLDFWYPWLNVREAFQHYYERLRVELPFYQERLLCYQCYTALSGLRFFAQNGDEPSYQFVRSIIQQKLD